MKNSPLFASFLLSLFLFTAVASATPGIPHWFSGSVMINGAPAPDGVSILAKISNIAISETATAGGVYGQAPASIFYVGDVDNNHAGKTITFYVSGFEAATAIFTNGAVTKLDLSVTGVVICGDNVCDSTESCSSCSKDCGACPSTTPPSSGGSSGGGGGGGGSSIITKTCNPDWSCGQWGLCSNGKQTRVCIDINKCNKVTGKPAVEQSCVETTQAQQPLSVCPNPGMRFCSENDIYECSADQTQWVLVETCPESCESGKCLNSNTNDITGMLMANSVGIGIFVLIAMMVLGAVIYKKM